VVQTTSCRCAKHHSNSKADPLPVLQGLVAQADTMAHYGSDQKAIALISRPRAPAYWSAGDDAA